MCSYLFLYHFLHIINGEYVLDKWATRLVAHFSISLCYKHACITIVTYGDV